MFPRTAHRRTLASAHQEHHAMGSSAEPTKKKHPNSSTLSGKDSDPIIKSFSKLYSSHQNGAVCSRKDSVFLPRIQIETSFEAKPISVSEIQDKPVSKSSHRRRKTTLEVEKQKLRASIIGVLEKSDKPNDFKIDFLSENKAELKKLAKKERGKEETIVSLSKSHDSGSKVTHRDMKRPSFSSSVSGGQRRSLCNSQSELADFFSCNGVKIVSVDMPPFMQIHAVDCARKTCDSLEKFTSKTLAFTLKKEFDGVYGPVWHCIVGTSFGSFVTHSVGGFLYFSIDHKFHILLFKTSVQRATH